jgi:hypothetical protein
MKQEREMNNTPTRFCIEEESFKLSPDERNHINEYVDRFINLISKLKRDNQNITCWSGLDSVEIFPDLTVGELIYNKEKIQLEHDMKIRLMLIIGHCEHWDDSFDLVNVDIEVAGNKVASKSLNYVFEQIKNRHAMACVCFSEYDCILEKCKVIRENKIIQIYFLTSINYIINFYRDIIEIEDLGELDYILHAQLAFPDLYFVEKIHRQFSNFKQKYTKVRPQVTHHLSFLNDDFRSLCEQNNYNMHTVISISKSMDVDLSIESDTTRHDKRAMKEREVIINGESIICEYHTKLTLTHDRIHFHQGKHDIADGKIIIGIFAKHLTT